MKPFVFAFLLLAPLRATATPNPCTDTSTGPCTPDGPTQKAIMGAITDGLTSEALMKAAAARADKARSDNDYIKEHAALQDELAARQKMQDSFNKAIAMTETAYKLTPAVTEGGVAEPHGPENFGKAWAKGVPVKWDPAFSDEKEMYMKISKDSSADHLDHYIGGTNLQNNSGTAFPNGRVFFSLELFRFIAARVPPSPGFLAETIHHEAHHFTELIGSGWDSGEAGESRTYAASLAAADIFEVGTVLLNKKPVDFKVWLRAQIAANDRIIAATKDPNKLTPLFPSPDREPLYKEKIRSL